METKHASRHCGAVEFEVDVDVEAIGEVPYGRGYQLSLEES